MIDAKIHLLYIFFDSGITGSALHYRGVTLSALVIFVIRAIMGIVFAILLTRFFYPNATFLGTAGFAVGLVGLAYITERFRKRKKKGP
jgi:uncharacterized membrane protein